ncbi:phytoene desaturase family protein [Amnibacterium flavum]|uniref:Dehydrogenase n=1 Tax=Amnibacterium flavum TaxID=2173173 RepID=A0A2V1HU66_9MICO|nr:NAD(P)/FAD-dependent oxidoreductase [Amnibacterium flavum]PVZ96155.1 dehydrogenase [Amnibacterium flavum]
MSTLDAIVVGSGPNGLAAAVTLARAGLSVTVLERAETIGGGARTAELTLPGFRHDICSAVHPMAFASPFFSEFRLRERMEFVTPEISYAHPLDGGRAALAHRDIALTAEGLGRDGRAWQQMFGPLVADGRALAEVTGSALLRAVGHPVATLRLGLRALEQGGPLWNLRWSGDAAPALLSGVMAHAVQPMPTLGSAAAGLALATHAHAAGWPIPIGGSQSIIDTLAADLRAHGGTIETGIDVTDIRALPASRLVLFDTSAAGMARIAGDRLPDAYRARLRRFRFGNAAAKVDFALSAPVPWTNPDLVRSGTLHIGGTRPEVARGERDVATGRIPRSPYVLASQPTTFDPSRAPAGRHVLWTYTHVPAGSTVDPTEAITRQIERFAPGFRDVILASASSSAEGLEVYNPNYVGGDIASGAGSFAQLLARPVLSPTPWRTPAKGVYLASASASPGPGVHGMAGWNAAVTALRDEFGVAAPPSLAPDGAQHVA